MKDWSRNWKSSKNPGKQRKYTWKAPLHIRNKLVASHLSKELKKKYLMRSLRVRKGDKVKIMRGSFKGTLGSVERVNTKTSRAYISGVEVVRKDGSKAFFPVHSSNLLIHEVNTNDKRRLAK